MNLYQLTQNYTQALNFLTDPENEIDLQTALDTMESLDGELDDKLLNVGRFIASMEAEAEAISAIAKRQKYRATALENKAGWLRDYLQSNMNQSGRTAIKAHDIALKLAKLPASVKIIDERMIPAEFWKEKVTLAVDKNLIKSVGGCDGVCIESNGFRVSIK
jgi:hypothetical protein